MAQTLHNKINLKKSECFSSAKSKPIVSKGPGQMKVDFPGKLLLLSLALVLATYSSHPPHSFTSYSCSQTICIPFPALLFTSHVNVCLSFLI